MRFEYRINLDDLTEANVASKRMVMSQVNLIPLLIFLSGFVTILLISLFLIGTVSFQTIFIVLFTVFITKASQSLLRHFPFLLKNFSFEDKYRASSLIGKEVVVEASDEGLSINTIHQKAKSKWSAYTYWQETPNLFLVYLQGDTFYIIFPKRAFINDSNIHRFRELLQTRIFAN